MYLRHELWALISKREEDESLYSLRLHGLFSPSDFLLVGIFSVHISFLFL